MLENVKNLIIDELESFNNDFAKNLKCEIEELNHIISFILANRGKQLRPILGILLSKMFGSYTNRHRLFLEAIELIHNATLFHDDVIDGAVSRRKQQSLNEKFSNKTAILVGDYFLSSAIKLINRLESEKINKLFSDYMNEICKGEIEQNLTLFTIPLMSEYIEKTERKTALLFELTTKGIAILSDKSSRMEEMTSFGKNFGIMFQIKDDLNNFKDTVDKPVLNDLHSGVITAPIIFLNQKTNVENLIYNKKFDEIFMLLNHSSAFEKTQNLIDKYYQKALNSLEIFDNNIYKTEILNLLSQFRQ